MKLPANKRGTPPLATPIRCGTFWFILFSFLLSFTSHAQNTSGRITGTVINVQNQPLPAATVLLLHANDSTTVKTTASGEDGKFIFKKLPADKYVIRITAVGYKQYTSSLLTVETPFAALVLPAMVVQPANSKALQQVTVTAKKPLIEHKVDRVIINVDAMITAAGSNALDALSKGPGVFVDIDGNINLNGKGGVLVLIDDKPTYLSAQDLAAYLRSLPAGMVEKIELISNPPARYDASGSAVINLQLKKNKTPGCNGNISTAYNQGIYARTNNALNINYRDKKVNLFGNISYARDAGYTKDNSHRNYYTTTGADSLATWLNRQYAYSSNSWNIRTGLDYYASAKTTIGILLTGGIRPKTDKLQYNSHQLNANEQSDSTAIGATNGNYQWYSGGVNLNMQHKTKTNGELITADVDYINIHVNGSQYNATTVYEPTGNTSSSTNILYQLPADINIWSAKTDYTLPLKGHANMEAGYKSSYVNTNYRNDWYNQSGSTFLHDDSRSDHFVYAENINAAYVSADKEWQRWSVKAGVRIENTNMQGHQPGNTAIVDSSFKRSYTDFFPSLHLSRKADSAGHHVFTISYSTRIRRPNYQQLNPFLFYSDRYSYNAGNPALRPQYMNAIELQYDYKNMFGVTLAYGHARKLIQSIVQPAADIFITRPENFGTNSIFNIISYVSTDIIKGWHINASLVLFHLINKGIANGQTINNAINSGELEFSNQFRLSKSWSAELSGFYASSHLSGQTRTGPLGHLDAGVRKMILKDKGTIQINAVDIFHTIIRHDNTTAAKQLEAWRTVTTDTQRAGIAFSYRFGKDNNNRKRNHNTGGAAEEQGRVN